MAMQPRFTDFSGSYSKALLHDGLGVPNAASWLSLKNALTTGELLRLRQHHRVGRPAGGPTPSLNGPQGALAFDLEGLDSHATVIPPAPRVASAQTAAEAGRALLGCSAGRRAVYRILVEFPGGAGRGGHEQSVVPQKQSANNQFPFPVTTRRICSAGSSFLATVTSRAVRLAVYGLSRPSSARQPLSQQYQTFLPVGGGGSEFMTSVERVPTDPKRWRLGPPIGLSIPHSVSSGMVETSPRIPTSDVLYQAYFVAFLVLAGMGAPPNPGNPYIGSRTEKAFGTLGGPDAAGTVAEMATRALKAAWFHKWIKDLRMRPEEYGALVQAKLTNTTPVPQAAGRCIATS